MAKDKTEKWNAIVREWNSKFDGGGDGVSSISLSGDTVLKSAEASHIYIWWKSFPDITLLESEGMERERCWTYRRGKSKNLFY